ncbi:MAG: glycosyltransferase family 2 protein [Rhodospirillales bacterium]
MTMQDVVNWVVWVSGFVIAIGVLQNAIYLSQLVLAWLALSRRTVVEDSSNVWGKLSDATMPISILAPAFNESKGIVQSIRSLLSMYYPNFRVIVINDGSTDDTLEQLVEAFRLVQVDRDYPMDIPHRPVRGIYTSEMHSRLLVIDKKNGGKADALNAGINVARTPLICSVDADSVLESDALLRAVEPFIQDPARVVAVGGTVRLANGCLIESGAVKKIALPTNLLALFQVIEYLRAFLMGRLSLSSIDSLLIVSGAFGIFRRWVAVEVGGYSLGTVGEDMEIIVKIHRHLSEKERDYEVVFVPEPVCWTEAPENLSTLARQRRRWQRGTLETFFKHGIMLANSRYGRAGIIGFLNILVSDVIAPVVELFGYLVMPIFYFSGLLSFEFFAAYLAMTFVFGIFLSVGALALEEMQIARFPRARDLAVLTAVAVLENFGYRQINNLWRIQGWLEFLRQERGWGAMERKGLSR